MFIDKIKVALRISHTKLDDEITDLIATAKAEMEIAGILSDAIDEADELIADAIKVFCKYNMASDEKMRDGFFASWTYQLDNLRKTSAYTEEDDV